MKTMSEGIEKGTVEWRSDGVEIGGVESRVTRGE